MQQKMDCEFDIVDRIRRSGLSYKCIESVFADFRDYIGIFNPVI